MIAWDVAYDAQEIHGRLTTGELRSTRCALRATRAEESRGICVPGGFDYTYVGGMRQRADWRIPAIGGACGVMRSPGVAAAVRVQCGHRPMCL